jgi:hypothetical protein
LSIEDVHLSSIRKSGDEGAQEQINQTEFNINTQEQLQEEIPVLQLQLYTNLDEGG